MTSSQADMIERVARAMCEQCAAEFGGPVKLEESPAHEAWISSARAAIEAMREPTEAMCEFAEDNFDRNGDHIAVCHRAMMTAALATQNTED
jgi:hypothetical protein